MKKIANKERGLQRPGFFHYTSTSPWSCLLLKLSLATLLSKAPELKVSDYVHYSEKVSGLSNITPRSRTLVENGE